MLSINVMLVSKLNRLDLRLFDGDHEWRLSILIDEVQIHFTLNKKLGKLISILQIVIVICEQYV